MRLLLITGGVHPYHESTPVLSRFLRAAGHTANVSNSANELALPTLSGYDAIVLNSRRRADSGNDMPVAQREGELKAISERLKEIEADRIKTEIIRDAAKPLMAIVIELAPVLLKNHDIKKHVPLLKTMQKMSKADQTVDKERLGIAVVESLKILLEESKKQYPGLINDLVDKIPYLGAPV